MPFLRSLKSSIALIICLNILVFAFLGISVKKMSEDTIETIGTAYMDGMSEQVSLHFETIIDLRLTMAKEIPAAARWRRLSTAPRPGISCAPPCTPPTAKLR